MSVITPPAPEVCDALRRHLAQLVPQSERFAARFFAHLAHLDASLAALFPEPTRIGTLQRLVAALCAGHAGVQQRAGLLARQHAALGMCEAHYDHLGTALLLSLHDHLGTAFTPTAEDAWAMAYGELAEAMIAAVQTPHR